ncbi:phage tail sheath subtilisin-like domain-containing protein [Mesorhizobium japonicum]|uniref:Mlr6548 protein n=1 Tax=Mesorhizobium japonicum (strain LMG 29417 / CECT 9101 / MAFF 303099) TaxID=266835 RepID=Q988X8_RHILO|nr:phage tail sheath subtilisin-like domain-containing protein [Mesorhizobium japonicum]BAB52819.1 mlr6548 [Mesorhizobium japonicum MAFF 303099]
MPEYLHPGVYIEEIERGPRPIEGVPTSTAAFLGETERGPIKPRLVTSYKEYQRWFGGVFGQDKYLPYAINGFFENGGKRVFVSRLVGEAATTAQLQIGSYAIRASAPGSWGKRVWVKITPSSTKDQHGSPIGFRIQLAYWTGNPPALFDPFTAEGRRTIPQPSLTEDFNDLVLDENSPDYVGKRFPFIDLGKGVTNQGPDSSALGLLVRNVGTDPFELPQTSTSAALAEGGDDDPAALGTPDYVGLPGGSRVDLQGLSALELDPYRDVALVYAPAVSTDIANQIIIHCENMRFRFAVIDSDKGMNDPSALNPRNILNTDTNYAGYYYPWIWISDPATGARKLVPPGGHSLGVFARTDSERGVFKAPANELLRGALDLEIDINDQTQDVLNPQSVNVIRQFPGRGIRIWGARTITSNALWKYVSVRRLFIFLERSIYEGTQWVVFEPNDPRLWARVTDTIRLFLRTQWRLGALYGRTEEQAFFITCNETVMSQDDILNGRLICEIGIAPVRPAEFVIFRIFQNTAEAQR